MASCMARGVVAKELESSSENVHDFLVLDRLSTGVNVVMGSTDDFNRWECCLCICIPVGMVPVLVGGDDCVHTVKSKCLHEILQGSKVRNIDEEPILHVRRRVNVVTEVVLQHRNDGDGKQFKV